MPEDWREQMLAPIREAETRDEGGRRCSGELDIARYLILSVMIR
jgi:hypothetical protein